MASQTVLQLIDDKTADLEWFDNQFKSIVKKFDGKFVAILNKQIIQAQPDFNLLIKKLRDQGIDPSSVMIQHISKIKYLL